ncbi:MAG TPA: VWA domain-containing protein, partial [Rectinemataceae bacterium]|nr:VWA domain-containing protein [Rectinemataceae bacterium]
SVESSSSPRVLVIDGAKRGASFIDSLYPAKHLGPAEAQSIDPADWELIVDDGLPLKELGPSLSSRLAADARAGRTSLLFAADSADFGRRGDNPALESVLPVTLLPPSLKDLPDMAVLILLDYSGSMYGGKLSLAKVTSLELLRGLKPDDRVGLLLFSDKRKWIWSFIPSRQIQAAPLLDPVEAEGGTELAPALMEGMDRLADTGPGEKHIVVISDGVTRPADFQALAARARQKGITISTMGVGEDVNRALLEKLAAESGGRFHLVTSADEIPALIFEDRKDQARPRFAEGRIPILDPAGTRVAVIGGMAQYAIRQGASTLYSNEVGDPLFAELDSGRRAIMLFASDLHGGFTGDFFANPSVAATLRDRLDSLFADRPRDIAVLETGREARVTLRSDALVAPSLELSRPGTGTRRLAFSRRDGETWEASVVLPDFYRWRATLEDRGTGLASFDLRLNDGVDGIDVPSARAAEAYRGSAFRILHEEGLWLLLFFASALGLTLAMRRRR